MDKGRNRHLCSFRRIPLRMKVKRAALPSSCSNRLADIYSRSSEEEMDKMRTDPSSAGGGAGEGWGWERIFLISERGSFGW
ncbi:hypothetical protein TNIN_421971 [Trichonephila inaurata madagascariensis]|uniref:Uncharacterized protein n=1 Tax=Trichonephila inaurata madagascariensis TaxID=2747483 RepID=A0A8X7CUS7_9ARAC|nr:hypothetical protein TNIN_421971 [Trichonephila inaurata madagascariensis]